MKTVVKSTIVTALCLGAFAAKAKIADIVHSVTATIETDPVPGSGDAADDSAVLIHPKDASKSLIVGTDKTGGIAVYDLNGKQVTFQKEGKMNNIDIRYNFPLAGKATSIIGMSNRTKNSISLYTWDEANRKLVNIAARDIKTGISVYGFCMYRSPITKKYFAFINAKSGVVQQWELFDKAGKVDAKMVRTFSVKTQVEGCAADDEYAHFYLGEEYNGIFKYNAEPEGGTARTTVDKVGSHVASNVEGISIYYGMNGRGYIAVSSQGNNRYVLFDREDTNKYVATFAIVDGPHTDGTNDTDGIKVVSYGLGPNFPEGVFIAQDGSNTGGRQNFKLVPWGNIARAAGLRIESNVNPYEM